MKGGGPMRSLFYRMENTRIKEKNYLYYTPIGITWIFFLIRIILINKNQWQTPFYLSELFYFAGALKLAGDLYENLFFVRELGKRSPRLKKYETAPLSSKSCYNAYAFIMAKYLLTLTIGSMVLHFIGNLLMKTDWSWHSQALEGGIFLMTGLLLYLLFLASGIWANAKG